MKIEIKKVNVPDGTYWYGIWIDDSCQSPSYGTDLDAVKEAYKKIIEIQKNPPPAYEVIESIEI